MPSTIRRRRAHAGWLLVALAMSACSAPVPSGSGSPSSTTAGAPATSATTASPVTATLARCAAARDVHSLHAVHRFSVAPDDIAVDPTGRIWVTAREANQLISMSSTGTDVSVQTVPGGPEGVVSDASTLYVAQQNLNAISVVGATPHTLLTLPNRTINAGIDGIGLDTTGHRLLIPDSPTGRLLAAALPGGTDVRVLAARLGRPVAAAVDPGGDVFVASESSPGLTMFAPTGGTRTLGHFADLDEVAWYAGLLYVTELDRHDVVVVDPATGAVAVLAAGLPAPQGLAVTAAGLLEIVDATTQTLYSIPSCSASS